MASYQKTANGKWSVRFRVYDGQKGRRVHRRLSGFRRKKDAESAMAEIVSRLAVTENPMTLGQLAPLYLEFVESRCRTSTVEDYRMLLRLHIEPCFGRRILSQIGRLDILEWQNALCKRGYSHHYKTKIRNCFLGLFRFGMRYHGLKSNPLCEVEPFRDTQPKKRSEYWSHEEFCAFLGAVDKPIFKALFSLLYYSGLRKGEALALGWQDVDLQNNTITVNKSISRRFCKKSKLCTYTITAPKNASSNRLVTIPESLALLLRGLRAQSSPDGFVFGGSRPIAEQTLANKLREYAQLAGVKRIRIHDLRHSHASLLINKGVNILAVARRLGHANTEQTLNTYSHLMPMSEDAIRQALEE